jgi:anti-anti-sigma factor
MGVPAEFSIALAPPSNGAHVVALAGELDVAAVPQLSLFLARLQGAVRVDCTRLTFIDAAGIRALLQASANGTDVELVRVSGRVRRLFEATHTTSLLAAGERGPPVTP